MTDRQECAIDAILHQLAAVDVRIPCDETGVGKADPDIKRAVANSLRLERSRDVFNLEVDSGKRCRRIAYRLRQKLAHFGGRDSCYHTFTGDGSFATCHLGWKPIHLLDDLRCLCVQGVTGRRWCNSAG